MTEAEFDNRLRIYTYKKVVESGFVPKIAEAATDLSSSAQAVGAGYRRLSETHAFVLDSETGELWRVAPFSAVPTAFPVRVENHTYAANCAWDALGVPAMLGADAVIPAACACCNQEMVLQIKHGELVSQKGLIHIAAPARRWYEDVVFT